MSLVCAAGDSRLYKSYSYVRKKSLYFGTSVSKPKLIFFWFGEGQVLHGITGILRRG